MIEPDGIIGILIVAVVCVIISMVFGFAEKIIFYKEKEPAAVQGTEEQDKD